jgi:hypothetical protein
MTREEQIKQEVREVIAKIIPCPDTHDCHYPMSKICIKDCKELKELADSILSLKTDDWSIGIVDKKTAYKKPINKE